MHRITSGMIVLAVIIGLYGFLMWSEYHSGNQNSVTDTAVEHEQ